MIYNYFLIFLFYLNQSKLQDNSTSDQNLALIFKTLSQDNKSNASPSHGNIDHQLEQFIDKLQQGFSSIKFSHLSLADKITLKPLLQFNYCPLCFKSRDQVYNHLQVETLYNSNQKLKNYLRNNTKYLQNINKLIKIMDQIKNILIINFFPSALLIIIIFSSQLKYYQIVDDLNMNCNIFHFQIIPFQQILNRYWNSYVI
ncbi:unnamed protein product [Paramecium sonneborni]|uniref:Transmembrane protein n=1 Tax=Paramecium sonneborni TaxID=65129 RepID=A0A8S1M551_9CILI|nr:unnamed protein product [Paramecium sonneborni]